MEQKVKINKKRALSSSALFSLKPLVLAERVGFEPTYHISVITRFRVERVTASFATSPLCGQCDRKRK